MSVRVIVREAGVSDSPTDLALLDDGERARAERKRQATPFVTGHALVRRVLGELLDRDPATLVFERRCTTCDSVKHGKPHLVGTPGWHFSLSYTPDVAVVAVAQGVDVGVDVEDLTDADFEGFAGATLARDEAPGFADLTGHDLLVARPGVGAQGGGAQGDRPRPGRRPVGGPRLRTARVPRARRLASRRAPAVSDLDRRRGAVCRGPPRRRGGTDRGAARGRRQPLGALDGSGELAAAGRHRVQQHPLAPKDAGSATWLSCR
uniref:Uncharacterized protein n=1 Tax=Janibacter limosus TaxID=53458 RepID=A0AC61U1K8_9MICO|nr:hypothetical protein [Janibacter limosus]